MKIAQVKKHLRDWRVCEKHLSLLSVINDEDIFDYVEIDKNSYDIIENINTASIQRGKRFKIINSKDIDFKNIKNVHFVKGTFFDRDYFRRNYPYINIRNIPAKADLIIYDEKSLFANDTDVATCYKKTNIMTNDSFYFLSDYVLNSIGLYYLDGNLKKLGPKSDLLKSFTSKYIKDFKITSTYYVKKSKYIEELIELKKPFIDAASLLVSLPSINQIKEMSLSVALSFVEQACSSDLTNARAAFDTVLNYDDEKYFAIKLIIYHLLIVYNYKYTGNSNVTSLLSNRARMFVDIASRFWNEIFPGNFYNYLSTESYFNIIQSWNTNQSVLKFKPKTDLNLLKSLLLSQEYFNKLSINVPRESISIYPLIRFNNGNFAEPIVEADTKNNLSEFIL